jgi:hypothetical protein
MAGALLPHWGIWQGWEWVKNPVEVLAYCLPFAFRLLEYHSRCEADLASSFVVPFAFGFLDICPQKNCKTTQQELSSPTHREHLELGYAHSVPQTTIHTKITRASLEVEVCLGEEGSLGSQYWSVKRTRHA